MGKAVSSACLTVEGRPPGIWRQPTSAQSSRRRLRNARTPAKPPNGPGLELSVDNYRVKDLMVPLSEYASVSESASLYDAVLALEKAQAEFDHTKYRHRAVLVLDGNRRVIGKLGQLDVLRALESTVSGPSPVFADIHHYGFSESFIRQWRLEKRVLHGPLTQICGLVGRLKAKDFMQSPSEGEFIGVDENIDGAIHRLVSGSHMSLIVTGANGQIAGILRLTDVFAAIFHAMKECQLEEGEQRT
jgi:CBS-domain-containing membrane protein